MSRKKIDPAAVRSLLDKKMSRTEVAEWLGVTVAGVMHCIARKNLTVRAWHVRAPQRVPNAAQRDCLSCRRPFASEHAGNRICARCKTSDDWRTGNSAQYEVRI